MQGLPSDCGPVRLSYSAGESNLLRNHFSGDSVNSVLVITHCSPLGLPQQGLIIAQCLCEEGQRVRVLGRANSSWGRLLEIVSYSLFLVPRYDVVLVDVFGRRAFVYEAMGILWARIWRKHIVAFLHSGYMPEFVMRWPRWTHYVLSQPNLVLVPHRFLQERLSSLAFSRC